MGPTFTVVTPADEDARLFISIDTIRSITGIPATGAGSLDDTALTFMLAGVLAQCAASCDLATSGALPPTLAQEVVRASWVADAVGGYDWRRCGRGSKLVLPWRAPITSITVTEAGVELVEGTDYQLDKGVLDRITSSSTYGWPLGAIVVDYTAGWLADDDVNPVPANLVMLIASQVRLAQSQSIVNPILRSEDITGLGSWSFNTPGGDAIDTNGLSRPLYEALNPYRQPRGI